MFNIKNPPVPFGREDSPSNFVPKHMLTRPFKDPTCRTKIVHPDGKVGKQSWLCQNHYRFEQIIRENAERYDPFLYCTLRPLGKVLEMLPG